jgi:putative transposase
VINKYLNVTSLYMILKWSGYPRSSWYYQPRTGKRGIQASTHSQKKDGTMVSNEEVTEDIRQILGSDLDFYGYEKMTWELHDLDYIINKKKVYRLMREANLLLIQQRVSTTGKRQFVQFRCIDATAPLEYLVMDIKYVRIDREKRFAYLLTVMDVYSRFAVGHTLKYSIKKADVILLLDGILRGVSTKGIIIRNDNGSQFLAHNVRKYLTQNDIIQEFTHIATPEENSYIEAWHSSLERELLKRTWFDSIYHAREKLAAYYLIYNYRRKHRSLKRKSPYLYLKTFFPDIADKHPFAFSDSLSRVASVAMGPGVATCLALDKARKENEIFVTSGNQKVLLN